MTNLEINKKVLSIKEKSLNFYNVTIKPDPDRIKKPMFRFHNAFFSYFFKKGKLSIQISKLDGRQSDHTFEVWKEKVLKQIKKAGVNYFADDNLEQFNTQHETYVQERVEVKKQSQIAGEGAFARIDLNRGDFLGFYAGDYKQVSAADSYEQAYYFDLPGFWR